MAGTLKQVRIKVACAYGDVGSTFTPNGTLRDWLIANGYAELLPEKPAGVKNKARAAEEARGGLFTR